METWGGDVLECQDRGSPSLNWFHLTRSHLSLICHSQFIKQHLKINKLSYHNLPHFSSMIANLFHILITYRLKLSMIQNFHLSFETRLFPSSMAFKTWNYSGAVNNEFLVKFSGVNASFPASDHAHINWVLRQQQNKRQGQTHTPHSIPPLLTNFFCPFSHAIWHGLFRGIWLQTHNAAGNKLPLIMHSTAQRSTTFH